MDHEEEMKRVRKVPEKARRSEQCHCELCGKVGVLRWLDLRIAWIPPSPGIVDDYLGEPQHILICEECLDNKTLQQITLEKAMRSHLKKKEKQKDLRSPEGNHKRDA